MPINLKQLKGQALNSLVNRGLEEVGGPIGNLRANFNQNGLQSISGNFNQLLKKHQRPGRNPNQTFRENSNPTGEKVYAPLIFPTDLDNEHYMMFHVMDRRRPSRANVVTKRAMKTVVLPVPSGLTDSRGVAYNTENLTAIGALGAGRMSMDNATLSSAADMLSGLGDLTGVTGDKKVDGKSFDNEGFDQLSQNSQNVGNQSGAAQAAGVSAIVSKVASKGGGFLGALAGAASAGAALKGVGLAEGIAMNPHTAILFDNVNFRSFSFNYKFIARSQQESNMIKDIINTFQYAMLPSAGGKFAGFAYEYPEEFELEFADALKPYMFTFGRCVLQSFNVNYNGENMPVFFEQTNAPVSITIDMQFQETQLLSKESIQKAPFELPDADDSQTSAQNGYMTGE